MARVDAVRDLLRSMTRHPDQATRRQKVGACVLLLVGLVAAGVDWTPLLSVTWVTALLAVTVALVVVTAVVRLVTVEARRPGEPDDLGTRGLRKA